MTSSSKINFITYNSIKVLMYHKIVNDDRQYNGHWTVVTAEQLHKHLLLLERWGYTPITFRDFLLFEKGKLYLPKKSVIITFDDGYEEVYKIAFPMLKEFGWNAVVFVLGDRYIKTDIWDKEFGLPPANLLSEEQIVEMHNAGFEIGSHSMRHTNLLSIPHQVARYEIKYSKEVLQSLIKSPVKSFCYPYGFTNNLIKNLVRESGYDLACGVYTGPPKFWSDRYDIRRITISNSTNSISFALKILAPYEYYEWAGVKTKNSIIQSTRKHGVEKEHASTGRNESFSNA